jgi:protease I
MTLSGKTIAILMESDYYEPEIWYYRSRFREEGMQVRFLTRLWGNDSIEFKGHEHAVPFTCNESFEDMPDDELQALAAVIVPSGMVADRLRYTEDVKKLPPATVFLQRVFAEKRIVKGIICHGMWLLAPAPQLIAGRRAVVHNNLLGDLKAYGGVYVDEDVVVDDDLVTARTGDDCGPLARTILEQIRARETA